MNAKVLISACLAVLIAAFGFAASKKKAAQSEARTNLAAISTAQMAYYDVKLAWGVTFGDIEWKPIGETVYAYYMNSCEDAIPSSKTSYRDCPLELKSALAQCHESMPKTLNEFCPSCTEETLKKTAKGFCAAAVANLDKDSKLDIWVINPLGPPRNVQDDIVR